MALAAHVGETGDGPRARGASRMPGEALPEEDSNYGILRLNGDGKEDPSGGLSYHRLSVRTDSVEVTLV
jgi:hypothetical protein